jgi:ribosome recycling factor
LRFYASKSKAAKSTANLVPGSKQQLTDEAAIEDYKKAENKMQAAIDWYRKEVAGLETRASGRVTPSLLAPVKVELPDSNGELFRLEDVATVGVREGSTLLVTVFEEHASVNSCAPYYLLISSLA